MELIERYIYAVTRKTPIDQREDVADELRASIEDALDARGSRSKKDVKAVLTELGNPAALAQKYSSGERYLIGPMLYPYYIRTLRFAFAIGVPIAAAGAVISQIVQNVQIHEFIPMVIWVLLTAAFHILFWVTLVFVIFQYANVSEKDLAAEDPWTPDMLLPVQGYPQIPVSEAIGDIICYGFVALLPFIAQSFVGAHIDGQVTPFFSQDIGIIWSVAAVTLGLAGVIKGILKLRLHKWTPELASFNVVYALVFSAALIALPLVTQVVNPAFVTLLDTHIKTSDFAEVNQYINWTLGISIVITVGIYLYDAFNSVRLARRLIK